MNQSGLELFPCGNQSLVYRVELVRGLEGILQPEPLRHRRLDQGRGGVGVIFQQLGRISAVVSQIEPAIKAKLIFIPRFQNSWPGSLRDSQAAPPIVFYDSFGGGDAKLVPRIATASQFIPSPRVISSISRSLPAR